MLALSLEGLRELCVLQDLIQVLVDGLEELAVGLHCLGSEKVASATDDQVVVLRMEVELLVDKLEVNLINKLELLAWLKAMVGDASVPYGVEHSHQAAKHTFILQSMCGRGWYNRVLFVLKTRPYCQCAVELSHNLSYRDFLFSPGARPTLRSIFRRRNGRLRFRRSGD